MLKINWVLYDVLSFIKSRVSPSLTLGYHSVKIKVTAFPYPGELPEIVDGTQTQCARKVISNSPPTESGLELLHAGDIRYYKPRFGFEQQYHCPAYSVSEQSLAFVQILGLCSS